MADSLGTVRAILTPLVVVFVVALVLTAGVIAIFGGLGVGVSTVADLFGSPADTGQQPADGPAPNATFAVEASDGGATVEHTGGEPINASTLFLEVGGDPVGGWSELGGGDVVEEGDTVTVDNVSTDQAVSVRWISGDHSIPLHTETV